MVEKLYWQIGGGGGNFSGTQYGGLLRLNAGQQWNQAWLGVRVLVHSSKGGKLSVGRQTTTERAGGVIHLATSEGGPRFRHLEVKRATDGKEAGK